MKSTEIKLRESILLKKIDTLFVGEILDLDKYEKVEFIDHIQESASFHEMVIDHLFGNECISGDELPWSDCESYIKFRPNELTVYCGINGHGKSALVNQIFFGFIKQGCRCLIASLEMRPQETLARMICQAYGIEQNVITTKAVDEFFPKIENQLFLYKETGDMDPNRVHALCRYARLELSIDHILIDSMMKCGIDEGDSAAEKKFINALQNIAKNTGIHIHLITHAKKGIDEYSAPGKFDVHGSAHITNLPDNVIIISRNKRKEDELHKGNPRQEIIDQHDAYMKITKQRHGNGWEGEIGLWWHSSRQYNRSKGLHRSML